MASKPQASLPLAGDVVSERRELTEQPALPTELLESPSKALVERAAEGVQLGSLQLSDPGQVVVMAQKIAKPLAELITSRGLFANIGGKRHVYVEGWATCGAMLGVVPRLLEEHEDPNNPGEFIATVEAVRTQDGMVIGRAKASCGMDERDWGKRSRQARRSMAQTRATGKVFRLLFSWVMQLAGYETTPFEELDPNFVPAEHPQPERSQETPRTAPRGQRVKPSVTLEQYNAIGKDWLALIATPEQEGDRDAWVAWVQRVCGREFKVTAAVKGEPLMLEWTPDDLAKCHAELRAAEGG